MNDFNLKFIEKATGKEFKGKRITTGHYSLVTNIEPFTTEKITTNDLRKRFRCSRENRGAHIKGKGNRIKMFMSRTLTKEFREYLDSSSEMVKENAS